MSMQSKELSPVSMITEQLSNFHISESSGFVDTVRSLNVKEYIFGKATSLLLFDTSEKKDKPKVKSESVSDSVFFAVNIPNKSSSDQNCSGDAAKEEPVVFEKIEDALKAIKLHKHARFKSFSSKEEAEKYSLQSTESESVGTPNVSFTLSEDEDGLPSVKCQDLVKLRKTIEEGNVQCFKKLVWENARYLVNYHGDTPSILHEGFRYNALHIASRCKQPFMCQLILDTLGDPKFFDKIYKCDPEIRAEKIRHLLDQYLNNPDKRLGETPLHFASKFGCLDTVKILLSHPYCIKDKENKYGDTAAKIICTRCSSTNETLTKNMEEAFKGLMYVPVLRAENNVIPPSIEKPCTKFELEQKLNASCFSVNNPKLIVKAFAGPMSPDAANTFYKIWKNPSSTPKQQSYTVDEQKCIHKIRLTDTEKGLERAGRNIAQDLNAEWLEYWPALEAFINLGSSEGLRMLETHLSKLQKSFPRSFSRRETTSDERSNSDQELCASPTTSSYINPLGHFLNSYLRVTVEDDDDDEDVFYTPPSSPESSPKLIRHNVRSSDAELFVNGSNLSRLDFDMFLAIRDINIDTQLYPCISRWKSFIHSKLRSLDKNNSNAKSLTPLASIRVPRLRKRSCQIPLLPRNLFLKSDEVE